MQVGVGVCGLLPDTMDGITLEILAIDRFGMFSQGAVTGMMLGGLGSTPAARLVGRAARAVAEVLRKMRLKGGLPIGYGGPAVVVVVRRDSIGPLEQ